jgi:hypothetical protein
MFKWKKKGLIFSPKGEMDWMNSHSQCPYSLEIGKHLRIYFCTRGKPNNNNQYKSYSGYVDVELNNTKKIIDVSKRPILDLGGLGEFDEFGSMAGSVVPHEGEYYLYYCGWQRGVSTPYNWAIGIAKSNDGKKFTKIGTGPILGPILNEPFLQACPIVYKINKNNWHMFYLSGVKWIRLENNKKESQYLLMHAISKDGINWNRDGIPIIDTVVENECQTSCSIIELDKKYHMFFSYRHGTDFRKDPTRGYRIGYAYSSDMLNWIRDDSKAGLDVSEQGWDSKMVAYPHLRKIKEKTLMFYCGNHFGYDGFGYAELEN